MSEIINIGTISMDVTKTETHTTAPRIFGVHRWLLGSLLIIISAVISVADLFRASAPAVTIAMLAGTYLLALLLRVIFLHLSTRIMKVSNRSIGTALVVVAFNAMVLLLAGLIVSTVGIIGIPSIVAMYLVCFIAAFWIFMRMYKARFVETLAVYGISLAMFAVVFFILALIFRVSLGGILNV